MREVFDSIVALSCPCMHDYMYPGISMLATTTRHHWHSNHYRSHAALLILAPNWCVL